MSAAPADRGRASGHELVRRTALFSISVVVSTIVGVFSIPIINAQVGALGFGMLTLAQAIMAFFVVLMAFGWGATGPSMVSALPVTARKPFFAASLRARLLLCAFGVPVSVGALSALTGLDTAQVVLSATAYSLPAVGAAWYFIGTNRPVALFVFDGLPPLIGQVAGLLALLAWPNLTSYLICVTVANLIGAIASWVFIWSRPTDGRWTLQGAPPLKETLRGQVPGVLTTSTASLWAALPIVLVNQFAPAALPEFAIVDKLYKYAIIVLAPVLQSVQGWVPERGRHEVARRSRIAVTTGWIVGLLGGVCLAVLTPVFAPLISLGHISVSVPVASIAGLAFVGEAAAQISGLSALVALGHARRLATSSTVAALVGIGLVVVLVVPAGVLGAVTAMCLTAMGLASYRTAVVWRASRSIGPPASVE